MFSKLKHLKDLRNQAKTIQGALSEEKITVEKHGISVVMDGNMNIISITILENLAKEDLEKKLAECLNSAIKETQKKMAQKMQQMGGFPGL